MRPLSGGPGSQPDQGPPRGRGGQSVGARPGEEVGQDRLPGWPQAVAGALGVDGGGSEVAGDTPFGDRGTEAK